MLGKYLHVYGPNLGYQKILNSHPAARRMICWLQDTYYLRKALPDGQWEIAVAAVAMDKQYPYDISPVEEEML